MKEKDIMQLITNEMSWEQVLYKVIAWEGLDPWDLDIVKLSETFINHVEKMEELDFKIPAKYVIIASVLLRMKSEHLHFIDWLTNPDEEGVEEVGGEIDQGDQSAPSLEVNPISVPPKRYSSRKITANELVLALRKVINVQEKRQTRTRKARKLIRIEESDITDRINKLYERINMMMNKIKSDEIRFSEVVEKWDRDEVIRKFVPLIYLQNERKVACRQQDFFQEIFISQPMPETKPIKKVNSEGERVRRLVPAV